jgi:hypothetical protein
MITNNSTQKPSYYERNKERIRARLADKNSDAYKRQLEYCKRHREKDESKARKRKRYAVDVQYRLSRILRQRLYDAVKDHGVKEESALKLIGCSMNELKEYITSRFLEGMSWENYGHRTWHIDHIRPVNTFNLTDPEQQKECFHYSNLRPLWAVDNQTRPRDGSDVV